MAPCPPSSAARRPRHDAVHAQGGVPEVQRIVAVHLFPQEERGLVAYHEADTRKRRLSPCRIIVHLRKYTELVDLLPHGVDALKEWLHTELEGLEAPRHPPRDRKAIVREVMDKLVAGAQRASKKARGRSAPPTRRLDPRIRGVITLLERACDEKVSAEFAARVAEMSKSHFLRTFTESTGMTFKAFITRLRVHVAAALLVEEPLEKVTTIAYRAGPWELCTFERAFKKVMGCTPRGYRARHPAPEMARTSAKVPSTPRAGRKRYRLTAGPD